jgi:hypothetical protein
MLPTSNEHEPGTEALDIPPWDEAGAIRRDCEPHRGVLLTQLGSLALALSIVSIFCLSGFLFSLPLGLAVWLVARRDLASMEDGQMDPAGLRQTEHAVGDARFAFWFSLTGLTFVLLVLAWTLVRWS